MSSSRAGPRSVTHWGEVDDHGDVLVTAAGVTPHVLVDPDDLDAVEPVLVVDQHALPLGQDRVVGGVPRDTEPFGDPRDREVLDHDPFQGPPQPAARQLGPRLGGRRGVLAPHMSAAGTPVATHDDIEHGRAPAQRLVRQPPEDRATRGAFAAASAAPLVRPDDSAGEYGTVGLDALAGNDEAELVEAAKGGQIRAGEARPRGSVRHVEVFRMGSVRTSILGRPRRLPRHRRAGHLRDDGYILICEEPRKLPCRGSAAHARGRYFT